MNFDELYFVASAWNTGNAILIDGYDFLVTTTETIGLSNYALIINGKEKKIAKVLLADFKTGIALLENVVTTNSLLNILNFELSAYDQKSVAYQKNLFNKLHQLNCEIVKKDEGYNISTFEDYHLNDGTIIFGRRGEFLGLVTKKNEKPTLLPAKYIMKLLEEFSDIDKESVRCLNCENIIEKNQIINNSCPFCNNEISKEIIEDISPKLDETARKIETLLIKNDYELKYCRYGKNLWNISRGSASVFIRYNPKSKFIAAFSPLYQIKNNSSLLYKFLMRENAKLEFLTFSLHKDMIYLDTPYFVADNFKTEIADIIFKELFRLADYYDDVLAEMDKE